MQTSVIHATWFSSISFIYASLQRPPLESFRRLRLPKLRELHRRARTTLAMAASAALRRVMAQDPVLTACAVLSAIGVGAPLIVPSIRNAMNRPEPITPPELENVVEGMTGTARN